jgi:hypothetical protein
MSCAVLTNAPKQKEDLLNAPNTPMWFIKTSESKQLWNIQKTTSHCGTPGVIKDNGAFIILWPRKPLNTPCRCGTDLYSLQSA